MSKARNTGNLNNAIQVSETGAISFMSGSTMLMSINTTGQMSGSAPVLSSSYADNATTASFAVNATSATTASFATNFTVAGNLVAQTLVVQTITSSVDFVTGSTRFGSISGNTHQFTGSLLLNGSASLSDRITITSNGGTNPVLAIRQTNAATQGYDFETEDVSVGRLDLYGKTSGGRVQLMSWLKSTGYVGIGTTSPTTKLEVAGRVRIADTPTINYGQVVIAIPRAKNTTDVTEANCSLTLSTNETDYPFGIKFFVNGATLSANRYVNIQTGDHNLTNNGNIIFQASAGKVGIGTIAPSSTLGVKSTGADGIVLEQDAADANNSGRLFFPSSTQTFGLFNNVGDLRFTYGAQAGNTSGTSLARFTNTGKYFRMESGTGGIQFGGDTAAANALDDYEEGTWTPTLTGGSGSPTYSTRDAWYTKVGRVVTISWFISFQKSTLSGGTLRLTNFPFSLLDGSGVFYPQGTVLLDNLSSTINNITLQGANNNSSGDFIENNGSTTNHAGLSISALGSGTMACRGTLTYFTT